MSIELTPRALTCHRTKMESRAVFQAKTQAKINFPLNCLPASPPPACRRPPPSRPSPAPRSAPPRPPSSTARACPRPSSSWRPRPPSPASKPPTRGRPESDILFLKRACSILRQSSNPVCDFSLMEQGRDFIRSKFSVRVVNRQICALLNTQAALMITTS